MNQNLIPRIMHASFYPKITIITPSYNQGAFIEETILSVIKQDYPNLEYIVMDGGSTDNTVNIIKKYADKISYWVSEKDKGQTDAINKGLKIASGDIINWINSDDQLMPGALEKVAKYFTENPDAVIVHGRIEYFGETVNYYSRNLPSKNLATRYAAHICMPQPATFFRRKLVTEQGLLDENLHFSMDTDLYVRAALQYDLLQVNNVFARFRLHENSKSVSSFNRNFLLDNKKIFSRVLATLNAEKAINEMKRMGLFEEPTYLYNQSRKTFNESKLVFYFLRHRLSTLYFNGDRKEFKRIFRHIFRHHTFMTLSSGKILLYRLFLFFPPGFFHSLAKRRDKAPA